MRIVSKQTDYYDSLQGNIVGNSSIKYIRQEKSVPIEGDWPFKKLIHKNSPFNRVPISNELSFYLIYVGLCGTNYHGVKFEDQYFYTLSQLHNYLMNKSEVGSAKYEKIRLLEKYNSSLPDLIEYFRAEPLDYEADPQYPIAVSTTDFFGEWSKFKTATRQIHYDCLLRPYEFFKAVGPYELYMKLESWHANQVIPEKPLPIMSDSIKINARGFDKWSFRKMPSKKK